MVRKENLAKGDVKRGAWTAHEDQLLYDYIMSHGLSKWRTLPVKAGLNRCGKSCRLRWLNYLRPGIKRGNINEEEEDLIVRLHKLLGNRWSLIAGRIPGRTDNEIKNYWNTCLRKKFAARTSLPPHDTNAESIGSAKPAFNQMEAVKCIETRGTEQSNNHENYSFAIMSMHQNSSPCHNAEIFSLPECSDANGEMQKLEESKYPLLDENDVWDSFCF